MSTFPCFQEDPAYTAVIRWQPVRQSFQPTRHPQNRWAPRVYLLSSQYTRGLSFWLSPVRHIFQAIFINSSCCNRRTRIPHTCPRLYQSQHWFFLHPWGCTTSLELEGSLDTSSYGEDLQRFGLRFHLL